MIYSDSILGTIGNTPLVKRAKNSGLLPFGDFSAAYSWPSRAGVVLGFLVSLRQAPRLSTPRRSRGDPYAPSNSRGG